MSGEADEIGSILTGSLAAAAVDHVGAHAHAGAGGTCLNCGAIRAGDFCQACGQSGHTHRHVMAIGHDIAHGVFHFEGKFWSTLPLLVRRPGELTRRYVHGERAKFVSPMALFLFSVFLLFAAVNRVTAPDVAGAGETVAATQEKLADRTEAAQDKVQELQEQRADRLSDDPHADVARIDARIAATRQTIAALKAAAARLPMAAARPAGDRTVSVDGQTVNMDVASSIRNSDFATGIPGIDRQIGHVRENPALYAYKLKMASYKYSWALIPISVPLIWLMFFWRRDVGLYDHAIFAIYSLSFMTLLCVGLIGLYLVGLPSGPLWLVLLVVPPIHMYRQLKAGYLLTRFGAAWRTIFLLVCTSISGALFFALLLWLEAE